MAFGWRSKGLPSTRSMFPPWASPKRRRWPNRAAPKSARQIADLLDWDWPRERYDIVAALYIHFFDADRPRMHRAMLDALKPGGLIILESFRIEQLEFQKLHRSGGPRSADMLCSRAKLESDFAGRHIPGSRRSGCRTRRRPPA